MKVLAVLISVALIASVSAQNDIMRTFLMMRLLGGDSGSSSSTSPNSASSTSTGQGSYQSGGALGGLSSIFGRGMNPLLLMGGGDRMRDMMMCNMMQGTMRMMCMTRAFQ